MARTTAPGAVEAIHRQVRRVRRRRNLYELQRVIYLSSALGLGATAVLVLLALAGSRPLFARALAAVSAVALAVVLAVVRDARRRRIPAATLALWIDRRSGLTGRLATLVELARRGDASAALLPLLVEQNVARLDRWRADLLIPHRVPRAALAMAAGGAAFLALVVVLAPRLRPPAPDVVVGEVPALPLEDVEIAGARLAVAPLDPEDDTTTAATSHRTGADELRERIRRELWGTPTPESPAPAVRTPAENGTATDDAEEAAGEDGLEPAPSRTDGASAGDGTGGDEQVAGETPSVEDNARGLLEQPRDGDDETAAAGGAAAGAGNQPDPHLFGPPSAGGAGSARFALSLAARIRAGRGGTGEAAPPPAPPASEARADLAPGQRAEAAVPRMPIPLAYEALVRRLFSHEGLE